MEWTVLQFTLHLGLSSQAKVDEFANKEDGLIVLDDLMQRVFEHKYMELLFMQGCHPRQLSVIFITQNLYGYGELGRTVALNTWYLIVFKNIRDSSQLMTLGRQLFLVKAHILVEAYRDIMTTPYAYVGN
jgi:hypothetical protein